MLEVVLILKEDYIARDMKTICKTIITTKAFLSNVVTYESTPCGLSTKLITFVRR